MTFSVKHSTAESSAPIVIPVKKDSRRDAVLDTIEDLTGLSATQLKRDFSADAGAVHLIYDRQGRRYYLLGLGKTAAFADVLKAFRSFSHKYRDNLEGQLGINFLLSEASSGASWVEPAVNGLLLGAYRIGRFKSNPKAPHPLDTPASSIELFVSSSQKDNALKAAERGRAIAEAQRSILDLVNAPSNKKIPSELGKWALESGKKYGYKVRVLDKAEIEKNGLHALLAVNQGSPHHPVFIIMEYRPEDESGNDLTKVGLVGKGVTFDTGGLSIKPSANMHLMKSDMGGAAAVFGTMEAAARLKLPVHLIGIVPATDNSVDAYSVKPSDVISSHSGKTIEVIDTDAEGRLILADGLSYIVQHYHPDVLIDLATLTGSTVRTLGYHAAGLFSNNENLAGRLSRAADKCGERVWQLPLWEVYKEDLKSDVADIRNLGGKPVAGAITAAKFLEFFTHEHPAWAHLDIAGVAFQDSEFAGQKSATGFGVRLLVEYLQGFLSS